ncbi:hypothetical protein AVEN_48527-1 [Araneus ventricosus]|uniref:Uncharacterized protein n=1 Tax=Araneus ventricosus TaxID=182803 RepID=A0A4Y2MZ13_ARAVE|nr:hypothetical protein AVEN_48527-1 [Araneus ventricosus]
MDSVSCTFKRNQTKLTYSLSVETIGESRRNVDTRRRHMRSPPEHMRHGSRLLQPGGFLRLLVPRPRTGGCKQQL